MANPEELNINIKIDSIKLLESIIYDETAKKLGDSLNKEKFQYEQSFQVQMIPSTPSIEVSMSIKIFAEEEKTNLLASFAVKGSFFLQELQDLMKQFENKIPTNILWIFIGATASTARGMIILKTEGTILDGAVLPFLNPDFLNQGSEASAQITKTD